MEHIFNQDARFKAPLVQASQMAPEMQQEAIEACMTSLEKHPDEYEHCAQVNLHFNFLENEDSCPRPCSLLPPAPTFCPLIAAGCQRIPREEIWRCFLCSYWQRFFVQYLPF